MRLEKQKHLEAEQRLAYYFTRLPYDPSYDYEGKEEDIQLVKRKRREGKDLCLEDQGRRSA